ncbi:MAG: DUF4065 domain-containing protein [Clostridia bacterium]|nr:DUF4065 domain-containing protein [Clostridia bacterium]
METGKPLFSENFEAWQYGPVLSSVYHEFKFFGSGVINKYATDAEGHAYILKFEHPDYKELGKIFDMICRKFSDNTGIQLSELTHQADTPWANSYANGIIDFNKIKQYFILHEAEYLQ